MPLRDIPAQSLELLLKYMYLGELPLSNDNIQGVAATAFLLNVDGAFRWEKKVHFELIIFFQKPSNDHYTDLIILVFPYWLQIVSKPHGGSHGCLKLCWSELLGQRLWCN